MLFPPSRRPAPCGRRPRAGTVLALALTLAAPALPWRSAAAQMLASPVLQNGFANRGLTVALNYGSASGARSYGLAAAYTSPGSTLALILGAGVFDPTADVGGEVLPSRASYGARVAVMGPRLLQRRLGIAAFAGVGGVAKKGGQAGVTSVPAGLAVGYRRALGASRGIALYAAPFYSWSRTSSAGVTTKGGLFRVSAGLDVGLMPRLGVTIGGETGAKARAGKPGPTSAVFGAGLAYAFR